MKNHLKKIPSPRTWILNRKENKFIVRPNPGAHSFDFGMPLCVILRDKLKLASTTNEVKKLLNNNEVLIDGKRRKNHRLIVGLFDVITIKELKKSYRVLFDSKGRLVVKEIESNKNIKLCKIVGKTAIANKKIQFNLHDGKNILFDNKAKVGDTFVLELPSLDIKEVLSLEKGSLVYLTQGRHHGDVGELKEIKGNEATYKKENKDIETSKNYLFIIGKNKPVIDVNA